MGRTQKNRSVSPGTPSVAQNGTPVPGAKKQPLVLVAVVAFGLGFVAGVGFTVYKTGSNPAVQAGPAVDPQLLEMELALEQEAGKNPQNADTWTRLGNIYFDSGRYAKAIEAYEKSLAISPDNPNVQTDLGIMYRRTDRPQLAVEAFDRAIAMDPKHETARFNKGIVLLHDLADREGALHAWEQLLEINPLAMTPGGQSVDEMVTAVKQQAAP